MRSLLLGLDLTDKRHVESFGCKCYLKARLGSILADKGICWLRNVGGNLCKVVEGKGSIIELRNKLAARSVAITLFQLNLTE
jgi:hypothetical protein